MAKNLQDAASLLARIEGGDLIALEAKYHLSCLATFRNHHRSHIKEIYCASEESLGKKIMEAIIISRGGNSFFQLSELQHVHESHQKDFLALPKKSTRVISRNNFLGIF